jgi:type IV pilus assembly protein PilW
MEGMMQDRSKRGFTLIELMVAIAAFGIMSLAGFAVLGTGQRTAVSNDQTVQIQQNVRLAMDLIARDVRMASFGNALAGALPGCANPINTGDNAAGEDLGSDRIAVATVFQQLGTLTVPFTAGNVVTISAPGPILNDVISLEGTFTATVNGLAPVTLSQAVVAPTNYAVGTAVVQIKCITYTVSNGLANPPYQLLRDNGSGAVAIVDGIESLQIAYALDTNNDGIIDDQPGGAVGIAGVPDCKDFVPNDSFNNKTCPTQIGAGSQSLVLGSANYASANTTPTAIRQIRLTVVGRAVPPAAANFAGNTWRDATFTGSSLVQAEDQLIASTPGIRRRALTRMVTLRNGSNL